jgi:hypothetical protein
MSIENHDGTISTRKILFRPQLSVKPTSSHMLAKQEQLAKEVMNLAVRSIFVHTSKFALIFQEILRYRTDVFTSTRKEVVLRILIILKNSSPSSGFETANLGPTGKQDKH